MRVDAHQHFWAIGRGDYSWLTPDLVPLYRDFLPPDLRPVLQANGIDGTVLVQAAPTMAETSYMLELADRHAFILGVVGWVDFEDANVGAHIARLAAHPKLVGLRPMIQDIAEVDWMLSRSLSPALEAMIDADLVFDALTRPQHLSNLQVLMARHPDLRVVINHGSKPRIAIGEFTAWAQNMSLIAKNSSACVKLSGLVNEADPDWSVASLKPYVDHLLGQFGPQRLIWGSDWPVCTVVSTYDAWWQATKQLLDGLDVSARAAILGGNAARIYNLGGAE